MSENGTPDEGGGLTQEELNEIEGRRTARTQRVQDEGSGESLSESDIEEVLKTHWEAAGAFGAESVRAEGRDLFGTIKFPSGGPECDNGECLSTAVIRQSDGAADMILMDADMTRHDSLTNFAVACVQSIGGIEDRSMIREILTERMLIGDFAYLLFRLRQLASGDRVAFQAQCDRCGEAHKYTIRISDMGYELPPGFVAGTPDSRRSTTKVEWYGTEWECHWHFMNEGDARFLRNLYEQEVDRNKAASAGKSVRTVMQQQQPEGHDKRKDVRFLMSGGESKIDYITAVILTRLDRVVEPGGLEVVLGRRHRRDKGGELSKYEALDYVRKLPSFVRLELYDKMTKSEPGLDSDAIFDCQSCHAENRFTINPNDPNFFFPSEIQPD